MCIRDSVYGEGSGLVARLRAIDIEAEDVAVDGLGGAVSTSDLLLIEAQAFGPTHAAAIAGTRAATSVAVLSEVPVWLVAGVGRALPQRLWDEVADAAVTDEPWLDEVEVVSLEHVTTVVGPDGPQSVVDAVTAGGDCPVAAELLSTR